MDKIRSHALRMIGRRDFFVNEFRAKLEKRYPGYHEYIGVIIEELTASSWLSDERTVPEFIRVKSEYAGWGPRKISQKLKEKGVDAPLIAEKINETFSHEEQQKIARTLAEDKWKLLYKKKAAERTAAVQRFLASRGFDFSLILNVTRKLSSSSLDLPEDQ